MPARLHLETFGPVHALPVLHYRLEFAGLVAAAFRQVRPDAVAIELPVTFAAPFLRAVSRLPQVSIISSPAGGGSSYLLVEPADPLAEAARLAGEHGVSLHCIDSDIDNYPRYPERLPDAYSICRIGLAAYYGAYQQACSDQEPGVEDRRREQAMAYRLQQLASRYRRILYICGMAHLQRVKELFALPQAAPLERLNREGLVVWNLHPDSCREVMAEFPFLSAVYEYCRGELPPEPGEESSGLRKRFHALELIKGGREELPEERLLDNAIRRTARRLGDKGAFPNRQRIIYHLFSEAARHYRQETGESIHLWQKRAFFRFARNYAVAGGMLLPDLYQLLVAARGCVDDNFAYAFCRLATCYPWQSAATDLPSITLSPEELWGGSRRLRFRPLQKRTKGLARLDFLKRKRERRPGEWLEGFDDPSVCSYPPEDIAVEGYGEFLKRKGSMQLSEELTRTERLSASLLDGIDMRETLRHLAEGVIYVREQQRVKGGVGCVVVIFDEDRSDRRYLYRMTWLGEHDQESDMAFYATDPAENVVGPGICRCEYGGFLLSYPPRRMADVWHDPDYRGCTSKTEVLLLAALDYSQEKHVVYLAARPPRSIFKQLASRRGRQIVFIPLASLSPLKLKQIRVMHVLAGKEKRAIAKEYIW